MTHDETTQSDDLLDELIADYLQRLDIGTAPPRDELFAAHPDLANDLREFFDDLDHFNAGPTIDVTATEQTEPQRVRYFGEYELIREIARGGMGVVYEAQQKTLKRTVAVKMILAGMLASDEDVQRFRTEAQAAAGLQHSGIVSIHEVGVCQGQHYFSMDLVEGCSLADLVRDASLPADQAARYLKQVTDAVQFAHGQGTLHRDLKPSNILIDSNTDEPRVTDFGLAKQLDDDSGLTATGARLGTPSYMSPEQAAGQGDKVGPASDVYSLGAVLYELLTGRPPFRASSALQTVSMVMNQHPIPPRQLNPEIPIDIETVCLKCLSKDPDDRYESAADLAADLQRFLNDEPVLARRLGPVGRVRRWLWKHRRTVFTTAAILTVALLAESGRRWHQHWVESQKTRLILLTDGPPLTTTIRDDGGHEVTPPFTTPTAQPVRLTAGDYEIELAGHGMQSVRYRLFAEAGRDVSLPIRLPADGVGTPFPVPGFVRVVELDGRDTAMLVLEEALARVDLVTGRTLWETDVTDAQEQHGTRWADFTGFERNVEPDVTWPVPIGWDIDGDGWDDVVWTGHRSISAIAFSGRDGSILWVHYPDTRIGMPYHRVGTRLSGPAAVVATGDETPPDLLLTFARKHGTGEADGETRWIERVSGTTGETQWQYIINPDDYIRPFKVSADIAYNTGRPEPLAAAVVRVGHEEMGVLPAGGALLKMNLETGTLSRKLTDANVPISLADISDLTGNGQPDVLLKYDPGPTGLRIEAVGLTDQESLWTYKSSRETVYAAAIPGTDGSPAGVTIVSADKVSGSGPLRTYAAETVDGLTGKSRWSHEWTVEFNQFDGSSIRVFAGPDMNDDGSADVLITWRQVDATNRSQVVVRSYSGTDGTQLWEWTATVPTAGNRALFVSDIRPWITGLDGLPRLLVICPFGSYAERTGASGRSFILSASTGRRESTLMDAALPRMADLNGDGLQDLYWAEPETRVTFETARTIHTVQGQSPVAWRRFGVWESVSDLDNDGVNDLVSRDASSCVLAVSGKLGHILWHATGPTANAKGIGQVVGDIDGDGGADLIQLRRASEKRRFDLVASSGASGQTIWVQPSWLSSRFIPELAFAENVATEGREQLIVVARTDFHATDIEYAALAPESGATLWRHSTSTKRQHGDVHYELSRTDNALFVIHPVRSTRSKQLTARGLSDGQVLWQHSFLIQNNLYDRARTLPLSDLNGDGSLECISVDDSLIAFDVESGDTLWTWDPDKRDARRYRSRQISDLVTARVHSDNRRAVCFIMDERLIVIDDDGQQLDSVIDFDQMELVPDRDRLLTADLNGDDRDEFLMTGRTTADRPQHVVIAYDRAQAKYWLWKMPAGWGAVFATRTSPDGQVEVIAASGNVVYGLDGANGTVRWKCNGPRWWLDAGNRPNQFSYFKSRPELLGGPRDGLPRLLFRPVESKTQPECRVAIRVQSEGRDQ